MVHLKPAGLEVAVGESVNEWWVNVKVKDTTVHYYRLYKHLGYTKLIKHHRSNQAQEKIM